MRQVIRNWRIHLRRHWWIIALAAVLSGLEVALPFFRGTLPIGDLARGLIYAGVTAGAFTLRVVVQRMFGGE